MKPGVSFVRAGILPHARAASAASAAASSPVPAAATTSTSAITGAGLKKCIPTTRAGSRTDSAIAPIESDEVFVASTAPGGAAASSSRNSADFTAKSSTTASTTSSAPARAAARPPGPASRMRPRTASRSSADMLPRSTWRPSRAATDSRARAAAPGAESISRTAQPCDAATWAMPAPIVPAPTIATSRTATGVSPRARSRRPCPGRRRCTSSRGRRRRRGAPSRAAASP